jgi:hypothetical protein
MKSLHIEKKMITLLVIIAVIVGGLGFFAGSVYAKHNTVSTATAGNFGGQFRTGGRGLGAGGFSGGEVVSKDATSITVKARDGSSKIIFFTTNTPVMKMVAGQDSDIVVGQNITVMGTPNPDGSISASSIQIRPASTTPTTQTTQTQTTQ